ncbi:MAG TPA: efflux RND transporter periplasmic adaptor subunit [Vicinamibacterales bacterium]|nr:efflux RND transporter periplasmic adaptor subunit [Vicinamibacterales bacterium]
MNIADRRRRIREWNRPAAVVAALWLAGACSKPTVEEVHTEAAAAVKTMTVAAAPFEAIVAASGVVSAAPGADWVITAPEPARIVEMPKGEGDRVKTGDLLVRFEIPARTTEVAARRAEVDQARARVENAQASVTRLTTLFEHGVAAQKELEDAKRDLSEARAALAQAEAGTQAAAVLAARTVVRATFPGVVAKRAHNPGDMVEATSADVILRVVDPSKLQVVASVPIPDLARVQVGKPVRVLVPGAEAPEEGKVLTRPAAVEPTGVSADVRIALPAGTQLAVGTPVRVEIVAEQRPSALTVPAEAVIHEDEDAFVMIAGADNKAHKRKVTIGLTTPKQVEVTAGLKAGEAVIIQGQQGLPDGAAITQEK